MRGISLLAEKRLDSQEGLDYKELHEQGIGRQDFCDVDWFEELTAKNA